MNPTQFSVIVPVYNAEGYLIKCVDSIVGQTYANIEIILVNDGSTDSSPSICDEYAMKDNRVVVIHKANDGVSEARNEGIRMAKGEYIIFVDNDDYIELDSCEHFHNLLTKYPETQIISCGHRYTEERKNRRGVLKLSGYEGGYLSGVDYLKFHLSQNRIYLAPWIHIYQREFLMKNNLFFKKRYYMDDDAYWKPIVLLAAQKCIITDFVYYHWNIRDNSLSHPKSKEIQARAHEEYMAICLELEPIFNKIEDLELKARMFDNYISAYVNCVFNLKLYKKSTRHLISREYLNHQVYSKYAMKRVFRLKTFPAFFAFKKTIEEYYKEHILAPIRRFFQRNRKTVSSPNK